MPILSTCLSDERTKTVALTAGMYVVKNEVLKGGERKEGVCVCYKDD